MITFNLPAHFYDLNIFSVVLRLLLAVILGGIIGLQRGIRGQFAGFRTHILVCVGAALAMLTNQYICNVFEGTHDPARLGAQVITGVGFLGVGTILVTGSHKIKGLTTAAGLWASACLGLAVGIGFYSGAVIAAVIIYICLAILPKVEYAFLRHSMRIDLYVEISSMQGLKDLMNYMHDNEIRIIEKTLSSTTPLFKESLPLLITIKCTKKKKHDAIIKDLNNMEYILFSEEV